MYKTKLQELCQRKSWPLPCYTKAREGPDHNPSFTSTVTVNGVSFHSPSPARSVKQAQNDAAMLAFHHFSPSPLPSPLPSNSSLPQHSLSVSSLSSFPQPSLCALSSSGASVPSFVVDGILPMNEVLQPRLTEVCQTSQNSSPVPVIRDMIIAEDKKNMLHLYKNQLQSYVQKKNLSLPEYTHEWEGPPHAMRFKCKVTVDECTYESDKFYSTLKDAEHAAAEVALMSLSPGGVQEGPVGLYKNLLQEFAQKKGFCLPIYSTNRFGEPHMPIFVSQVEVEGELFTGQEAKSKKQAEMSAAKVAYMDLKERKGKSDQRALFPSSVHQGQTHEFSPDCSEANVITGLQHHANPKPPVSSGLVKKNQLNKDKVKNVSSLSGYTNSSTENSSLSIKSSPSHTGSTKVVSDSSSMSSTAVGTSPYKKRIVVYSRNANDIKDGGTLLPISDDKWVAYSYSQ
ncbi:hypothetical protein VNO78_33303 [Psophocarpus tetragonolobus]|uniref:DRBM domain-containing protein n=1 Tax=Psophocarpus tetragonolobus TaxID=3891 RepID=A0AAN9P249_PSOTE